MSNPFYEIFDQTSEKSLKSSSIFDHMVYVSIHKSTGITCATYFSQIAHWSEVSLNALLTNPCVNTPSPPYLNNRANVEVGSGEYMASVGTPAGLDQSCRSLVDLTRPLRLLQRPHLSKVKSCLCGYWISNWI